jgi:Sugar (and other) transporter
LLQVFYYSTGLFISSGLSDESAKLATIGIGCIMVCMTLVSIPLMDRTGRRTLHLYGLGGMFIMSIFITISFLIKVRAFQAAACWPILHVSELGEFNLHRDGLPRNVIQNRQLFTLGGESLAIVYDKLGLWVTRGIL